MVLLCQETPPACRMRRRVSRLIATTVPRSRRWAHSLLSDHVENAVIPQSAGDDQADPLTDLVTDRPRASSAPFWTLLANCGPLPSGSGPQCCEVGCSDCGQR